MSKPQDDHADAALFVKRLLEARSHQSTTALVSEYLQHIPRRHRMRVLTILFTHIAECARALSMRGQELGLDVAADLQRHRDRYEFERIAAEWDS